ncbi:MAG: cytochrome c oxidase accessory protein CcoG, partial [Pseudomonadales bacterium]|nr:cytochrome c oxidase accessory protein CcoG [Pseudomonadales bacterium]
GCAQCIDACNQVMSKMNYPKGLIRYTTERELASGTTHWLRARSVGYAAALTIMTLAFCIALFNRSTFEVDVLRERGELFRTSAKGMVSNAYSLRVVNKTQSPQNYSVVVESALPIELISADAVAAALASEPGELVDAPMTLSAPAAAIQSPNTPVTITLCETSSGECVSEVSSFLGPTS